MLAWSACRCPHDHRASKAATKYSAIAGTSPASMPWSWVSGNSTAPCGNGSMITMAVAITTNTKPTARPAARRVLRWVARLLTSAGYSGGLLGNQAVRHQAAPAASRGDQPFQPNRANIAGRGTSRRFVWSLVAAGPAQLPHSAGPRRDQAKRPTCSRDHQNAARRSAWSAAVAAVTAWPALTHGKGIAWTSPPTRWRASWGCRR
jgi:hypothetical protein